MSVLRSHPAAELFPYLEGEDFKKLVADIKTNGLREPIWLHPDGTILDGRNRYRACRSAGVEPTFRTWEGDGSPIEFVLSLNLHRRHLTQSQKAVIAAAVMEQFKAEAKERQLAGLKQNGAQPRLGNPPGTAHERESRERAGVLVGVSGRYVGDAALLPPDLAEQVLDGSMSLPQAKAKHREGRAPKPSMNDALTNVLDGHDPGWRDEKALKEAEARWDKAITAVTSLVTEDAEVLIAAVPRDRIESGVKSMAYLASWASQHLSKPPLRLTGGTNA